MTQAMRDLFAREHAWLRAQTSPGGRLTPERAAILATAEQRLREVSRWLKRG